MYSRQACRRGCGGADVCMLWLEDRISGCGCGCVWVGWASGEGWVYVGTPME